MGELAGMARQAARTPGDRGRRRVAPLTRPAVTMGTVAGGLLLMLMVIVMAGCSGHGGATAAAASPAARGDTDSAPLPAVARAATGWNGWQPLSPTPKPNITLTDTTGQPFDLQGETNNVVTLFYMGYTHCPDACPTTMAEFAHVLATLPPAIANQIKVVFVTTDPVRDTPSVLRAWLDQFNPRFIGLTGSVQQIAQVSEDVGMPPPQPESIQGTGGYQVIHASVVWAFDRQDNLAHLIYPEGTSSQAFALDLTRLVEMGWEPAP